jgi:two-component system, NarL family, response regulator NreC
MRSGLRVLLERHPGFCVVAEASDGKEAVELADTKCPDVSIIDIAMPRLNGIEATRQITAKHPDIAIIILSMHSDEGYVLRALKAGASGYLLKDAPEEDLIRAIEAVYEGKAYFSPVISKLLVEDHVRHMQQQGAEDSYELLASREREVLQVLAEGKSNKEAAAALQVSIHTIETHRSNILEKLNLHGTPELILYAVRKGVIS